MKIEAAVLILLIFMLWLTVSQYSTFLIRFAVDVDA
jgi:hypothetical protein